MTHHRETGAPPHSGSAPVVSIRNATASYGSRTLWKDLSLDLSAGEFLAVLGPNGAGKTTLLKVLLGQHALTAGTAQIAGKQVALGSRHVGYIPQQKSMGRHTLIRGRDLVGLGIDGNRWGIGWHSRVERHRIASAIEAVGTTAFANAPVSMLSGGEQQRLRIAQTLVTQPSLLLCDEPLASLDMRHQEEVVSVLDTARHLKPYPGIIFVTHEINPILPVVDRILYIAGGKATVGRPAEVMRSEVLSELYGSEVEVVRHRGRYLVFTPEDGSHRHTHHGEVM